MDSLSSMENTSLSEDSKNFKHIKKIMIEMIVTILITVILIIYLVGAHNIQNFLFDKTFLVRDNKRNNYSIYLDIENQTLRINNDHSFVRTDMIFWKTMLLIKQF
ncbi:hypothetical protein AAZV13_11G132100 [Glycine max]